jgi:hypothetical protein
MLLDQLLAFGFVLAAFAMIVACDFFIKVLNLRLFGYKKQI